MPPLHSFNNDTMQGRFFTITNLYQLCMIIFFPELFKRSFLYP